jgi:hypothetical protein
VPVYLIPNPVLRRVSLQGAQKNDSVITLRAMVDTAAGKELYRLPNMKFVLQYPNILR